ncbi:aminotransferase class I/II-fold pyridoxal phosphate-dependent enzyme [Vibrio spartinae]|uniref:Aspartate aminotransferase n=1 Tax=Vibrio spartinae TaxID=1918945 RepID=A0A1N6M2Z6_9VIBR|nr:aminotransferase class I/II-fold pyridoxal phosphate-dependent enzyme [Vibrio spartinae]QMV14333.1 aspartate aminotransferase [Vibrio spartinae]SIO93813.1 aspartate aminotransferase [Vibrio spartinae]
MEMVDLSLGIPNSPKKHSDIISKVIFSEGVFCDRYPSSLLSSELEIVDSCFLNKLGLDVFCDKNLSVHHGGRGALFTVLSCHLNHENVNIDTSYPYWNGYNSIVKSINENSMINNMDNQSNSQVSLLCLPNNPDGSLDIERLNYCLKNYEHVVIDLVYFNFLDAFEIKSISDVLMGRNNYSLIFSVSKHSASPNVRVGYVYTPSTELSAKYRAFQFNISNLPSNINRTVAVYHLMQEERNLMITDYYNRISFEINNIQSYPGIRICAKGMFVWITCDKKKSKYIVDAILSELNIKGALGDSFGDEYGSRWLIKDGVDYKKLIERIYYLNKG